MTDRTALANYFVDETGAAMLPFAILLAVSSWRRRAELENPPGRPAPASPTAPSMDEIEPALARA